MSHAIMAALLATTLAEPLAPATEPAPSSSAASVPATRPATEVTPEPEPEPELIGPLAAREREIQHDPELRREDRQATNLVITGSVGVGLGLGTLLLVSWPTHGLYRASLEEAEEARWVTSQAEPIADALHRRRISLISAGVGAGLTTVGAVILGVGLHRRARLRRPRDTLSLAPTVGGGHLGVAASMRF
ncbi:hypothetical protein [Paraliomyxa miuraensis]|uniref:hypothetical protein n=1 Tax=Paraliomyxa miuraensis TaxID=376150 RepID=UPI00225B4EEC|nr:hypothetical protein [Paraliomyxa miuraensis]MCX4245020.1 hypothetical protein [Paraliomyxa miuraensis]